MAYPYSYDYEAVEKEKQYRQQTMKTDRSMWKLMLFSILTFGIYGVFFFVPLSMDIDKVAPRRDGGKTMNFLFAYILSFFTLSIVTDIWHFLIAKRIGEALELREIDYEFGTKDFWLFFILGSFILVGPFIYFHKLCKAMNLLCADYNEKLNTK